MKNKHRTYLFCFVTSLYWFSLYTYVPILSTYAKSMGASYKMIGLIVGSYGLSQTLLRIPVGIISDTLKKRKMFIIMGLILASISGLGVWILPSTPSLLIFRSLSGAAAATWVTFTVLFTSYYKDGDSTKAIGIINSYNYLGQMTATFIGGIVAQKLGPDYTFLLASVVGIIGMVFSLYVYEEKDITKKPIKLRELLEAAKDKSLLTVSVLAILSQLLIFGTVYGFTPLAAKNIGATDFQLGILTTIATIPMIFASPLSATLFAKKLGNRNTIIIGFIITSLACVSVPFIQNIYILFASQFVSGFGRGLTFPLLMALSIKNIEYRKRGTAMGFFQAIYGIGMFLGPVMVGFLSDIATLQFGFISVGIIGIISAFITFLSIKQE